jgi:hypothetical protein
MYHLPQVGTEKKQALLRHNLVVSNINAQDEHFFLRNNCFYPGSVALAINFAKCKH